ncbi:hypothetical protein [Kitasatospora sp. NBC_01302]|uniref:hypothetical protein n=1 Tax=Kitasatospora sp. NBC_01302 TaxID=2903575 RepID=UPI002E148D82|nr:hypothetical protein OG294_11870 [Kitasatospora sp. NBC_01302]
MTGIEVAVGYLFAWALRKASRVSGQLDAEVNHVLDKGIDRLHNLVSGKLGENSALRKLAEEADAGQDQLSERTGDQVRLALEEAAEQDPQFAEALGGLIEELHGLARPAEATAGSVSSTISGGTQYGPVLQGRDFSNLSFTQPPIARPAVGAGDDVASGQG